MIDTFYPKKKHSRLKTNEDAENFQTNDDDQKSKTEDSIAFEFENCHIAEILVLNKNLAQSNCHEYDRGDSHKYNREIAITNTIKMAG